MECFICPHPSRCTGYEDSRTVRRCPTCVQSMIRYPGLRMLFMTAKPSGRPFSEFRAPAFGLLLLCIDSQYQPFDAMPALYPTVLASLACGASAFFAPHTMSPFAAGTALRRTSAAVVTGSSRRLSGGRSTRMSDSQHFDYIVIGGGSGGVASARRAATYDAKVCGWSLALISYASSAKLSLWSRYSALLASSSCSRTS